MSNVNEAMEPEEQIRALKKQNRRLRRAVDELSLLNDLASEIGASRDLDAIMQRIIWRSLSLVQAEQGVITVIDESTEGETLKTLVRTASDGEAHSVLRPSEGLLGWMQLHQAPLLVNHPHEDARFQGTEWPERVRSAVCVPLTVRSRLIGMLILYNKRGSGVFSKDDQRLLGIVAAQSAQVIENARLFEEEKALLRMREELRLAHEIQMRLLPDQAPELPGYDMAGISIPAEEVGGDYYDFILLDAHRMGFCVADVVGKGLPAALLMANIQATLRGQASVHRSAGMSVQWTNEMLCHSIQRGKFITLFYAILDPATGRLRYANAGHNRPMLRRAGGEMDILSEAGLVLGVQKGYAYQEASVTLERGDVLLMYSDGLSEAMNSEHEQFEVRRIEAVLHARHRRPARAIVEALLKAVQAHTQGVPASDDITMIVLKRTG